MNGTAMTQDVPFHFIARTDLEALVQQAKATPRRRSHRLLHASHADPVQRLLIAAAPGTYVRPHFHSLQWEILVALKGQGRLLEFGREATVSRVTELSPEGVNLVQLPPGVVHSFVVTGDCAVVMEIKPGSYRPSQFAPWAPEEETPGEETPGDEATKEGALAQGACGAMDLLAWMSTATIDQCWTSATHCRGPATG